MSDSKPAPLGSVAEVGLMNFDSQVDSLFEQGGIDYDGTKEV